MKKFISILLAVSLLTTTAFAMSPEEEYAMDSAEVPASIFDDSVPVDAVEISAPSAILMEKETGTVIFEKNADELYSPASVTKVMTMLLIVEAVDSGAMTLDDMVTVSANAASMGGSQVFLEEGEQMSLREMLKCIVVSSANDAAVAVAEHMAGSEATFARMMNERAAELGMANTCFENCTGLMDPENHKTTARDIAIMSRELIKHEWIKEYTTIWMDTIRDGAFGLSNTNKLIYYYDGSTGLKTGFTQKAMYCLSATACRDGVEYIAVVMHCETSQERFESAKALLNYAFANYTTISATPDGALPPIPVTLGKTQTIQPVAQGEGAILIKKQEAAAVTKELELATELKAPVKEGDTVGTLTIKSGEEILATIPITASSGVEKLSWGDIFIKILSVTFLGCAE